MREKPNNGVVKRRRGRHKSIKAKGVVERKGGGGKGELSERRLARETKSGGGDGDGPGAGRVIVTGASGLAPGDRLFEGVVVRAAWQGYR